MNTTQAHRNRARDVVDTSTVRRICAITGADPRTVDKVILGRPVRGDVAIRVLAVLTECGIAPLESQDAPPATKEGQS